MKAETGIVYQIYDTLKKEYIQKNTYSGYGWTAFSGDTS